MKLNMALAIFMFLRVNTYSILEIEMNLSTFQNYSSYSAITSISVITLNLISAVGIREMYEINDW